MVGSWWVVDDPWLAYGGPMMDPRRIHGGSKVGPWWAHGKPMAPPWCLVSKRGRSIWVHGDPMVGLR